MDGDARQQFYEERHARGVFDNSDKYAMFLDIIRAALPHRFLDLGCGDGSFAAKVKDISGVEVHAADIAEAGVAQARSAGLTAQCCDIDRSDLPYPDDFFDCIFCGELIEHVLRPEHLLAELRRVIRPGKPVLLTTPNLGSWYNRVSLLLGYQPIFTDVGFETSCGHLWPMAPMGHLRLYTFRSLRQFVAMHGFDVVFAKGIGINRRIGFGKRHPWLAAAANCLFRSPALCSDMLLVVRKPGTMRQMGSV